MSLFFAPYFMKHLLYALTCCFFLAFSTTKSYAQTDYKFIPENLELLSDEDAKTAQIIVKPDILLFTEEGKLLPMSEIQLMTNAAYKPLFYQDTNKAIKAIVFQRKSKRQILIEKNPEANYTKGEKALDFIAYDLDDNPVKLSSLKGKVVVLNFWFTKCGPCIKEMPELNALTKTFDSDKVVFLALTFDKKATVNGFLSDTNFDYKILQNANDVITMYNVQSYPTSIVIDQDGKIMYKELGYRLNIKEVLSNEIEALLK